MCLIFSAIHRTWARGARCSRFWLLPSPSGFSSQRCRPTLCTSMQRSESSSLKLGRIFSIPFADTRSHWAPCRSSARATIPTRWRRSPCWTWSRSEAGCVHSATKTARPTSSAKSPGWARAQKQTQCNRPSGDSFMSNLIFLDQKLNFFYTNFK
jgi:hypothetical protein